MDFCVITMETINEIEKDVIMITTKTAEFLLSNCPDALTLYIFYIKNSKIQETNSIWNTDTFGMKGLSWGRDRYVKAKAFLIDNKFLEMPDKTKRRGKFIKKYIKINYLFKEKTINDLMQNVYQNPQVVLTTDGETTTNALSNKSNALINTKEMHINSAESEDLSITEEELVIPSSKVILPIHRGNLPSVRLDSIYINLFNDKYGFNPPPANIGVRRKIFNEVLEGHTELQVARMLITFFEWRGMLGDSDWEEKKITGGTHSIYTFKGNLSQYEAKIRNVEGQGKEFDDDVALLNIVGNYILNLQK